MADVNVAVIYDSATGNVNQLPEAAVTGAEKAGADVGLRKVRELAPEEAIASNEGWSRQRLETQAVLEATLDDLASQQRRSGAPGDPSHLAAAEKASAAESGRAGGSSRSAGPRPRAREPRRTAISTRKQRAHESRPTGSPRHLVPASSGPTSWSSTARPETDEPRCARARSLARSWAVSWP